MGRFWGARGHGGTFVSSILTLLILTVSSGIRAAESDPLILFNHEESNSLVYSYFDTADPGMAYPVDIARLPNVKGCKTMGVFNGVLFAEVNGGELTGVDLGSGEKLPLNLQLPEHYVQEGPMVYIPPGKKSQDLLRMIDLRGPFAREVLFPSETVNPYNAHYATNDRLRYFYHDKLEERTTPAAADEVDILRCAIGDLRTPESPPLQFSATVQAAGQTWYIEPPHWISTGMVNPSVDLVRRPPQFGSLPFAWSGPNLFCLVALSLSVEGFTWEGESDGGPSLFILDIPARTCRVLALSALPLRAPLDPKKGGPDPNYYAIDPRTMALRDQAFLAEDLRVEVLSDHFSISRKTGPMQLLHGAQPLEMNREQKVSLAEVDASGERVLVKFPRVSVCYDIYTGYYAEADSLNCLRFIDRSELYRRDVPLPDGWTPLTHQSVAGLTQEIRDPARRNRATAYQLAASTSPSPTPAGERVSIQVTLRYTGTGDAWTEVPAPDFPVLSGTLIGPDIAVVLSKLPELTRRPPSVPVYLSPGGVLTGTVEFIPEQPGDYTLAVAYGGNPESEWFGRAKAPLLHFTVGERGKYVFDGARLYRDLEEFVNQHGKTGDKLFKELAFAGDEGADLVAKFLLETPMPRFGSRRDAQDRISSIFSLYDYLRDLNSPRQAPFYEKLLGSRDTNVMNQGIAGIRALHKDSKDPEFRSKLEDIVRKALANAEPKLRAVVQRDLGVVLWPDTSRD